VDANSVFGIKLDFAPPSVTKVVTKLEAAGLVRRHPDATDRRVVRVSTTADGNALLARIRQRRPCG